MARPDYRKRKGEHFVWHFCENCPDWPTSDYESRIVPGDFLCPGCGKLERDERCR